MPNFAFERSLLHTLADNVPHRIYAKDTGSRFVFANKAVAFGMGVASPEDLLGKTDFGFYPADSAAQYFAQEQEIMRTGQPLLNHEEHAYYVLSNTDAWMLTTKVPLRDDAGQVIGIVGINYDITERKAAEQVLRDARLMAEQAAIAKSELLATMSHELRTPLNSVLGYAQLLKHDTGLSAHQVSSLDTIERSGRHLLLLINDVLEMAKIESGKLELSLAAVHLPVFAQVVGDIIRVKAAEKGLHFTSELDPDLPPVVIADERRMGQILLNLLGNAVKFTDAGHVILRLRCVSKTPTLAQVRFEVADTGAGLRSDELEKIFEPFEQAGDRRRRAEGTGLGLAISRKLVEAMGAQIQVRSVPGAGSAFSFDLALPVQPTGSTQPATRAQNDAPQGPLVAPPEEEMKTLYVLARVGNMREIGRYASHLLTLGEQYGSVAQTLQLLAKRCESKAILELVQRLGCTPAEG